MKKIEIDKRHKIYPAMAATIQNVSIQRLKTCKKFSNFKGAISRSTEPILGLFVLIWIYLSYWIPIILENLNFYEFAKKVGKFWPIVTQHLRVGVSWERGI